MKKQLISSPHGMVTIALCCLLFTQLAFAQQVFEGEYVIEEGSTVASQPASSGLSIRNLLLRKTPTVAQNKISLGGRTKLVKLSNTRRIVPFSRLDDGCVKLIKEGAAVCSPNFVMEASELPNDPKFSSLWGLSSAYGIDAPSAWDLRTDSSDVVVAIIDTGVDYNHQDLTDNIWRNSGEIAGNGIDDDGNGVIDDVHGYNAASNSGNPMDGNGHGTHVAGTIGAVGNNSIGVVGVNWKVKIMPIRFLDSSGSGSLSDAIKGINYMVKMKDRGVNIRVSNNSWGGGGYSAPLFNAIKKAHDHGILFVAAAGNETNDNDSNPSYPASYDVSFLVSVAAIDQNQNLTSFSNYGSNSVHIAAPGVSITSTLPNDRYGALSGTSMATPHVAGAAALLFAHDPGLTPSQMKERLINTGRTVSTLANVVSSSRVLDLGRLLRNNSEPPADNTPTQLCSYALTESAYAPTNVVTSGTPILQADEGSFYSLSLPFNFSFYGSAIDSLTVSPNGVVYMGRVPSGYDYNPGTEAPMLSFAPLQTDLTSIGDGLGVWAAVDSDKVTITYKVRPYGASASDTVLISVVVFSDGTLESSVNFDTATAKSAVVTNYMIGARGASGAGSNVYFKSGDALSSSFTHTLRGSCSDLPQGTVRKVSVRGKKGRDYLVPNEPLTVTLSGTGSGAVSVNVSINGKSCVDQISAQLSNGSAKIKGKVPGSTSISKIKFSVGSKGTSKRVRGRKSILSSSGISKLCRALVAKF